MNAPTGLTNVVYPAADLDASVAVFTELLGVDPVFRTEDYAMFAIGIALSSKPWVHHPLPFWTVSDIAATHAALVAGGATAMGEIADGSLAEIGTAPVVNGDAVTGIVDMPGGRLAVLKAVDGNLIALNQPVGW
ncbi:VOC family protein [Nocardia sp. NPDC050712]|uniref:VOC family protein n=1 Tax=Nocardia sp. NPDC050712 TaxID=3155518 RepID=UPI0034081668